MENCLYIVPTPIGNLEDITVRAVKVLGEADIVACEDTRRTGMLLKAYKIAAKKLHSYHEHNEQEKAQYLVEEIKNGKSVAIVSDAGSPGISDPGFRIISEAIKNDIKIVPLPGATAFVPAITASGMAVNQFRFIGFPPQKKGRQAFLTKAVNHDCPVILYESSHRIEKLIREFTELCGPDRKICICREISKIHEDFFRGSLNDAMAWFNDKNKSKGEFVVVLDSVS